jgi:hypothetical protein
MPFSLPYSMFTGDAPGHFPYAVFNPGKRRQEAVRVLVGHYEANDCLEK